MNTKRAILQVYAELRAALGDDLPAGEVLDLAHRLVELVHRRTVIDLTAVRERAEREAVDQVIGNDGWRLVEDAQRAGLYGWDDDAPRRSSACDEFLRMAA